jgi:WD40 repeat protein
MVTDGTEGVFLYSPDGKLQKSFVPKDADDFRVFTFDAAISPDGKYGIAASVDLGARLLDLDTGKVVTGFSGNMSRLNAVAYAPDGKHIAIATATAVTVSAAPKRAYLPGFKEITDGAGSVAFSPDSSLLAVGGEDKSVRLFQVASGAQSSVGTLHEGAVRAIAWSRDGKMLASGSRDGVVRVWNVVGQDLEPAFPLAPQEGAVESLAWSAGGTVLAVAVSPEGRESSARPSEPERNPPAPSEAPRPVVQLWAVTGQGATLKRAVRDTFGARKIAFAPDGKLIAGFADGRVIAYDLAGIPAVAPVAAPGTTATPAAPKAPAPREDAEGFRTLTGLAGGAAVVRFSHDGQLLAAGNNEAQIGLWDGRSGAFVRRLSGHTKGVNSLAWSPDNTLVASSGEDRLQVARVTDGRPLWSVPGRAVVAGFSPDGSTVYAFVDASKPGDDQPHVLRAWGALDGKKGAALGHLPYPMTAAISPDGSLVAADQGTSQTYWDLTVLSVYSTMPPVAPARNAPGNDAADGDDPPVDDNPLPDEEETYPAALRSFSGIHGRLNALRWPSASRLLLDEGDYRDGHNDTDKPIPGKLGVRIFDPVAGTEGKPFLSFEKPIVALDENAKNDLAVAEDRVAIHVFDAQRKKVASWPLPSRSVRVKSLSWSPDGQVLAIGVEGAPVRLWRVPRA